LARNAAELGIKDPLVLVLDLRDSEAKNLDGVFSSKPTARTLGEPTQPDSVWHFIGSSYQSCREMLGIGLTRDLDQCPANYVRIVIVGNGMAVGVAMPLQETWEEYVRRMSRS
jgi:hypothetical protein